MGFNYLITVHADERRNGLVGTWNETSFHRLLQALAQPASNSVKTGVENLKPKLMANTFSHLQSPSCISNSLLWMTQDPGHLFMKTHASDLQALALGQGLSHSANLLPNTPVTSRKECVFQGSS